MGRGYLSTTQVEQFVEITSERSKTSSASSTKFVQFPKTLVFGNLHDHSSVHPSNTTERSNDHSVVFADIDDDFYDSNQIYFTMPELDSDGYDKDGVGWKGLDWFEFIDHPYYDFDGIDQYGFDRLGYDSDGYDQFGYNRDGYDLNGYDLNGYDSDGFDQNGIQHLSEDEELIESVSN